MTRAAGLRSSKRNLLTSNQNEVPVDCKENSLSILSQNFESGLTNKSAANTKIKAPYKKKLNKSKENVPPETKMKNSSTASLPVDVSKNNVYSPVRKSLRCIKPKANAQVKSNESQMGRNVLSDRTNSLGIRLVEFEEQNVDLLKTIDNKNKISHKLVSVPKPSTSLKEKHKENHIPVYKAQSPLKTVCDSTNPTEKPDAVYEFEVDENEETVPKKKRKKRVYSRKQKLGPKALTINNIKYSSTESLASLPEKCSKPVQKKKTNKNLKSHSLITTIDNSNCTTNSGLSFMSHAPLISHQNKKLELKHNLSTLQESQSEQCTSLHLETLKLSEPSVQASPIGCTSISNSKTNFLPDTQSNNFSPNPRCYGSKSGLTPNPYVNDFRKSYQNIASSSVSQKSSPCSTNQSTNFPEFLSSTPCKRSSLVVRNNSIFDESDDVPLGIRPSTGFMTDISTSAPLDDKCFGFDEPEELEEPLVSPIKNSIDLEPLRKPVRKMVLNSSMDQDIQSKPSVQEVINMLKATLPKTTSKKETTEVFETSSESSTPSSPTVVEKDTPVFTKPARRSYERPKKVQYDFSEDESEEEKEKELPVQEKTFKEVKRIYKKKTNSSKILKAPKITKAKQKMAKEEEELERLAAQMNAQFQQIEKVNLVVE